MKKLLRALGIIFLVFAGMLLATSLVNLGEENYSRYHYAEVAATSAYAPPEVPDMSPARGALTVIAAGCVLVSGLFFGLYWIKKWTDRRAWPPDPMRQWRNVCR